MTEEENKHKNKNQKQNKKFYFALFRLALHCEYSVLWRGLGLVDAEQ